jgi:hypothetical protein
MEVRTPAVSGTFYPGDEKELKDLIHECFLHELGPGKIPPTDSDQKIYGVICPRLFWSSCMPFVLFNFIINKQAGNNYWAKSLRNWSKRCVYG